MTRPRPLAPPVAMLATLALSACQTISGSGVTRGPDAPLIPTITAAAPPAGNSDACWGQVVGPSTTELVQQTVIVQEAVFDEDGTELSPAIYRNVTAPRTVSTGEGSWFERVCDAALTPAFVMSLQRALTARAYYGGPANGVLDAPTHDSLRLFQQDRGLDSDVLSLASAQQLGLVAIDLPPTEDEALGAAIDLEVEAVLQDGPETGG